MIFIVLDFVLATIILFNYHSIKLSINLIDLLSINLIINFLKSKNLIVQIKY